MPGGRVTEGVVRVGDTVRRPASAKSTLVRDLLVHLENRNFDSAPRFLGNANDEADEQIRRLGIFAQGYGSRHCSPAQITAYAIARQTALAWRTRRQGKHEIADWAASCASWTVLNLGPRLL